ncbi:hypothetical protein COLO4_01733 [Corchorus olitorius]|uniref:Uncharacterized protein n=1 Tax=Corchorus olitorius TaxID=93759 RepID=A0A1R3L2B0_9ROSI|nr:hypothetical protein COLO4_01733 [Corchorus olitorius]
MLPTVALRIDDEARARYVLPLRAGCRVGHRQRYAVLIGEAIPVAGAGAHGRHGCIPAVGFGIHADGLVAPHVIDVDPGGGRVRCPQPEASVAVSQDSGAERHVVCKPGGGCGHRVASPLSSLAASPAVGTCPSVSPLASASGCPAICAIVASCVASSSTTLRPATFSVPSLCGRASSSGAALSMASSQSMAGSGSVNVKSVAAPLMSSSATCGRASASMVSTQARRRANARASLSFHASGESTWPRSSNQAMSGTPGRISALLLPSCVRPNSSPANSIGVPLEKNTVASSARVTRSRRAWMAGSSVGPSAPQLALQLSLWPSRLSSPLASLCLSA